MDRVCQKNDDFSYSSPISNNNRLKEDSPKTDNQLTGDQTAENEISTDGTVLTNEQIVTNIENNLKPKQLPLESSAPEAFDDSSSSASECTKSSKPYPKISK